jgi:peptide subunit release factor 1 (eRF1)
VNAVAHATRRLAEHRLGHRVISLYLDLDPERFATPNARSSQIRSLIDDAKRRVDDADLDHDERVALRTDLERLDTYLSGDEPPFKGARALAVFCAGRDDLFEVVQLPRPVEARLVIETTPYIEPMVAATPQRRWGVILVNRKIARLLTGPVDTLSQHDRVKDYAHGQHDQGGWSQANYERHVEHAADRHLRHAAEVLYRCWQEERLDRLAVGGPPEIVARFESMLPEELRLRLVPGRVEVDVNTANEDQVRAAMRGLAEEDDKRLEREALDRLAAGIGANGRAAGGAAETVEALNERRVGTLLLEQRFDQPAARCTSCGLLVLDGDGSCPVDGTKLEHIDHLREAAVEAAVSQDAEVMVVTHYPDLGPFHGIGALLRF